VTDTDTSEPAAVGEPDPARFMSDTTAGEFWYELVLRDRAGDHEVRLTEVAGEVRVRGNTLTAPEFDETLASALEHVAAVVRGGRG
jgi:hypothetical protein